tara:strand:- start:10939 stop:11247 length:309 start_codon:yes stop_codon:yes gene_type:complete
MNVNIDTIFQIIVYITAIYLISNKHSKYTNYVGFMIFIGHLYRDLSKMITWPLWTEYIALLMALTLIKEGKKINNLIVLLIGIIIFIGHARELILNDGRYYY